jgi:hypothetical protein
MEWDATWEVLGIQGLDERQAMRTWDVQQATPFTNRQGKRETGMKAKAKAKERMGYNESEGET